jgi:hypothetical protein
MLCGHMNRDFSKRVRPGPRHDARGPFCQAVWVIPCQGKDQPLFEQAFAAITKDIGPEGLAVVLTQPLDAKRVLIGLREEGRLDFLLCAVGHTTPLGLGFEQIGLHSLEVAHPPLDQVRKLLRQEQAFAPPAAAELVGAAG